MQTLVLADRNGAELAPLTDSRPVALLPIGGRPLIEHALIALARHGVREATVVGGRDCAALSERLGDGARFGMTLTIRPSAPRPAGASHDPVLLVRGDMLWHPDALESALWSAAGSPPALRQIACGVVMATHASLRGQPLAFDHVVGNRAAADPACPSAALLNLREFHAAALDAIAGRYGLELAGQRSPEGMLAGRGASCEMVSSPGRGVQLGEFARVHRRAVLGDRVAIGDRTVVDDGTRVEDTVVMPDTYLGAGLFVRNAIVDGPTLIRVDTGAVARIRDTAILAAC